ncbi:MAG TPA: glycoside hydrolase family 28 protein [Terracidiphilus sp.]|nr:glycoside hydrolase family 28 protein [Terracidiphilus sp.]
MGTIMGRRRFLKSAAQAAIATPMLVSLETIASAQAGNSTRTLSNASHAATAAPGPKVTLNVRDLGAAGDGKTNDSVAIQQTIDRCSVLGGGDVVVPAGDYSTGALVLRSNVMLSVEQGARILGVADLTAYPLAQVRWEGRWIKGYSALISAEDSDNFGITGPGAIVGNPAIRGRVERTTHLRLPALLEFTNCRNVTVENCETSNAGMWSIHPTYCENVAFKDVVVKSGADGIDVDSCRHVTINGCDFTTMDDCISLKSGRGEEGYTINRPTEDVRISNCTFSDAWFACIGIGSETSAGIRNVHIDHCKCVGARTYAVYIKTRIGRGAFIEDIHVNDMDVSGCRQGFLRINVLGSGKQDEYPVPGNAGIPEVRDFSFTNIRVHDEAELVRATEIDASKPLVGLTLENITGTCGEGIFLANVKGAVIRNVHVTGYSGKLINVENVTGTGLAGAGTLPPEKRAKPAEPVAAPETPYKLH